MPTPPDKKQVMLHLLEDAWVYVQLDPRRDDVVLPEHLREQPRLILQYGYNMPMPINDLKIDERGISATLSFQRTPHATFIPWSAVFVLSDGDKRAMVWEDDVPKELLTQGGTEAGEPAASPPPQKPQKPARPRLVSVDRLEREEAAERAAADKRAAEPAPAEPPSPPAAPPAPARPVVLTIPLHGGARETAGEAAPGGERASAPAPAPAVPAAPTAPGAPAAPAPAGSAAPEAAPVVEVSGPARTEDGAPPASPGPGQGPGPGGKRPRPSHLKLVD